MTKGASVAFKFIDNSYSNSNNPWKKFAIQVEKATEDLKKFNKPTDQSPWIADPTVYSTEDIEYFMNQVTIMYTEFHEPNTSSVLCESFYDSQNNKAYVATTEKTWVEVSTDWLQQHISNIHPNKTNIGIENTITSSTIKANTVTHNWPTSSWTHIKNVSIDADDLFNDDKLWAKTTPIYQANITFTPLNNTLNFNDTPVEKKKKKIPKINANTLFYRANCGQWHAVLSNFIASNIIYKSINNEISWIYDLHKESLADPCQHDSERIMPLFNNEHHKIIDQEIIDNKTTNKNDNIVLYIKKENSFKQVPFKTTILINKNGRRFHHDSSEKVWYMAFTKEEAKTLQQASIPKDFMENIIEDSKNIFEGALPWTNGFSWVHPAISLPGKNVGKSNDNNPQSADDIYQHLSYIAKLEQKAKAKAEENKYIPTEPTLNSMYSHSIHDGYDYLLCYFTAVEDYGYSVLKQKAISMHKMVMFDFKLAQLKKDNKMIKKCFTDLELLQEAWDKVETHYSLINSNCIKPYTPAQSIFGYLAPEGYGLKEY